MWQGVYEMLDVSDASCMWKKYKLCVKWAHLHLFKNIINGDEYRKRISAVAYNYIMFYMAF